MRSDLSSNFRLREGEQKWVRGKEKGNKLLAILKRKKIRKGKRFLGNAVEG